MFNKHIFIPTFGTKIPIFFIYRYCLWLKNEIIRLDLVTSSEVERSHEISPCIVIPSVVEGSLATHPNYFAADALITLFVHKTISKAFWRNSRTFFLVYQRRLSLRKEYCHLERLRVLALQATRGRAGALAGI